MSVLERISGLMMRYYEQQEVVELALNRVLFVICAALNCLIPCACSAFKLSSNQEYELAMLIALFS
ncbi:hypothetical protein COLO4_10209 [Corchorus olitorius]|uniref:Uncharacterized protein n=1 Tax=Corchorus olitorius TaxID=93759 RepID=A0A1R3K9P9_9ROSI|nr:hypothetical protein COLO4_10209 [Corchorus olitorius]